MQDLDSVINKLAKIGKPLVEAIEAKPETTKDRYGDYMVAITKIAEQVGKPTNIVMLGIGVALQRAGANKAGVISALRCLGAI